MEELFSLLEETKSQNVSKMPSFGFVGYHPNVPIYESMGIENATVFEEAQSLEPKFNNENASNGYCLLIKHEPAQVKL
ncbi:hypothetical protein RJ639_026577 [Escallonia herrerae]|uniref:Uncharacterized protein n=1 Tax=Escallonia herrerae TaxID=1293975 RepID=A0AA88S7N6_9ASTE|nr:hypothetical protein RJ639_026577 [Escallonia herrerae]